MVYQRSLFMRDFMSEWTYRMALNETHRAGNSPNIDAE
jgi:hypothetical protein